MPRMPGLQLSSPDVVAGLTHKERRAIARALGENLVLMQELTWPFAGGYDLVTDTVRPYPGAHRERISAAIDYRLTRAQQHSDRTTPADVAWAHEIVASAGGALDEPFEPCFVLMDYKEQNATAERRGESWQISGVFDLMEGHFDNGEMDLCCQIALYLERDPALAAEFVRANLAKKPARSGLSACLPVYMLRERLAIWEWSHRPGHVPQWEPRLTMREWVEPFVAAAARLAGSRSSVE
jgi:hygromycin-B 7''-O-kinase